LSCAGTGAADAARALIMNHARVLRDLINPSEKLNIEGKPLTQRNSLKRAAFSDWWYADRFLMQVACRLVGPATSSLQIADDALRRLDPDEARAWREAAEFLDKRVQSTQAACPGRAPDMSSDAAAAMKTVMTSLRSIAQDAISAAAVKGILPVNRRNNLAIAPAAHTTLSPTVSSAPANARRDATVVDVSSANSAAHMSADQAITELTGPARGFQKWLGSKKAAALLDSWNARMMASLNQKASLEACVRAHFGAYRPPPDCLGWMLGLSILAETLPLSLTISDAQVAGFPLVFVNKKFTDVTGYSKLECTGRNCRFLQGPATDPTHGQMLLDTLREGQGSQIMMVNYCKSGAVFENLLTMEYVRDSLGRRRFCIGLQVDLTGLESDSGPWGRRGLSSSSGREMIIEVRKKMATLVKLLPQSIPVEPPPSSPDDLDLSAIGDWSDPHLEALASATTQPMPACSGRTWCEVLQVLLAGTKAAAVVVDMSVPGLPVKFINQAFTNLTGYSADDVIGRNCRFLQCKATEAEPTAIMISAIRQHISCNVQMTNARKDGSHFINDLTLHPIHDSNGDCRYCVGLLADHSAAGSDTDLRETVHRSLPITFAASLQPRPPAIFVPTDALQQYADFQQKTAKMVRMLWSTDADGALRKILSLGRGLSDEAVRSLGGFLSDKKFQHDEALFVHVLSQVGAGWSPDAGKADEVDSS